MAAPTTAYLNNAQARRTLKMAGVVQYDLPLALNSYGTSDDIKQKFFLDKLKAFKKKDVNGNEAFVFIGLVKEGGANINKHNSARFSKKRSARKVDGVKEVYVWLNDAGLNTKGKADTGSATRQLYTYILLKSRWYSSVFNVSSSYGFEWQIISATTPTITTGTINIGSLPQNSSDVSETPVQIPDSEYTAQAGDSVKFRAFVTNEEGTEYSDYVQVPLVRSVAVRRDSTATESGNPYKACLLDTSSPQFDVYLAAPNPITGVAVYQDEQLTTPALFGSYAYPSPGGVGFRYFFVSNGAIVTEKRCPEVILISMYVDNMLNDSYYNLYVQADVVPNTSLVVSGTVRIREAGGGSIVGIFPYSFEMLANADEQLFYVTDEFGDPMPRVFDRDVELLTMNLDTYYSEVNNREVVYQTQF